MSDSLKIVLIQATGLIAMFYTLGACLRYVGLI
jgi:hypothetical protein